MGGGHDLLFGSRSLTQGQLVALTSVTLVLLFLVAANVAVCWLYRRAATEDERRRRRKEKERKSRVWVYHVHRTAEHSHTSPESASQQILRKLRASHDNVRARLAASPASNNDAAAADERLNSLRREEAQALEELEVTTDLFLHETSCSSSRRSSLSRADSGRFTGRLSSSRRGDSAREGFRPDPASTSLDLRPATFDLDLQPANDLDSSWDFDTASTLQVSGRESARREGDSSPAAHDLLDVTYASYDLEVASALADLDLAATMHDLDSEKVSMSSVTLADFQNDGDDDDDVDDRASFVVGNSPRGKKARRSKRSRRGSGSVDKGDHSRSRPVAEFHNEAFEFTETEAAVERINDVEL